MELAIFISALISLIFFLWLISTLGNILNELRILARQQALLLAVKKAESDAIFQYNLMPDYERFYAMKKGKFLL